METREKHCTRGNSTREAPEVGVCPDEEEHRRRAGGQMRSGAWGGLQILEGLGTHSRARLQVEKGVLGGF